jgi:hypothetical protein
MKRRDFISVSVALAGLAQFRSPLTAFAQTAAPATSPQNLLARTYPENFLAQNLIPLSDWHPYPRFNDRDAWASVPADIRAVILTHAEKDHAAGWPTLLASTFLDFKRNGNRSIYESQDFGRRSQLQRLVLAECLEGHGRFLDDIVNGIWLICEESFWGVPAHLGAQHAGVGLPDVTEPIIELFGAETVALLAWTKYLLANQLDKVSPLINKRIILEAERRQLAPYRNRVDFVWQGLDGKNRHLNNWNPWINSNLLAANFLLQPDPKLRLALTSKITRSLDAYLNQYWPDAGCEEGPGYFGRSPLSYFECVDLLESATGARTAIFANPFIDAMGRYILNTHITGDSYINYGDAHIHASPDGPVLFRFGRAVHDAELTAFAAWNAARNGVTATGLPLSGSQNTNLTGLGRSIPAITLANEIRTAPQVDVMVRDVWYPYLGLMAAREKENSANGMYLAIQAANNGRSHSHNDSGSYILYHNGDPVAIDVGVEAYTAKTFGPDRYTIWTMQSAFHNLPTIGNIMQHDGTNFKATGVAYDKTDRQASLRCNLSTAYPAEAGLRSWLRTATLHRGDSGSVTIEENFSLSHPQIVTLSLMTPRVPTVNTTGMLRLTTKDSVPVMLHFPINELTPVIEPIPLTDAGLRSSWGPQIYRVLFKTKQPVASGNWLFHFSA